MSEEDPQLSPSAASLLLRFKTAAEDTLSKDGFMPEPEEIYHLALRLMARKLDFIRSERDSLLSDRAKLEIAIEAMQKERKLEQNDPHLVKLKIGNNQRWLQVMLEVKTWKLLMADVREGAAPGPLELATLVLVSADDDIPLQVQMDRSLDSIGDSPLPSGGR